MIGAVQMLVLAVVDAHVLTDVLDHALDHALVDAKVLVKGAVPIAVQVLVEEHVVIAQVVRINYVADKTKKRFLATWYC